MIRFWQGRAAESERDFERALEHARLAGDRRQEGEILRRLALAIDQGPTSADEGIRRLRAVLEESQGDRRVEIGVTRARAGLEAMRGRFAAARELIAHGKAVARELGDQVALAAVFRDAGFVEMLAGDPAAAEAEYRAGFEILERIGDSGHLASAAPDLGDAIYAQGRYEEADALAELTERITIEGDSRRPGPGHPAAGEGVGSARQVRRSRGRRGGCRASSRRGPTTSSCTPTRS